jgi:hypothetical protein
MTSVTTRSGISKSTKNDAKSKKNVVLEHVDDQYEKLIAKRAELIKEIDADLRGNEGKEELQIVDKKLEKLQREIAAQTNHASSSVTGTEITGPSPFYNDSNATLNNAASGSKTTRSSTVDNADHATLKDIDSGSKASRPSTVDKDVTMKNTTEASEETLIDELGTEWNVNVANTQSKSAFHDLDTEVIGHIVKRPAIQYVRRVGNKDACSAFLDSQLPQGSSYKEERDVTQRSNRILENILQKHRDRKEPIPAKIRSALTVLLVYWDSKDQCGYGTDLEVLDPNYEGRRPHTRCFIYLKPSLYVNADYNLDNKTGYSHETRSTVKQFLQGKDDWERSITLHNIAVTRENKFEEYHMKHVDDRPKVPLCELIDERKKAGRRSESRYSSVEQQSLSPVGQQTRKSPRLVQTPPLESARQPAKIGIKAESRLSKPQQVTRHEDDSSKPPRVRFHEFYVELFDLPPSTTYEDLQKDAKIMYPAQFVEWKQRFG